PRPEGRGVAEELQAGPRPEVVVEQAEPVAARDEGVPGRLVGPGPVDGDAVAVDLQEHVLGQEEILLVVVDQQDVEPAFAHAPIESGRSKISNQYWPSPRMTSTRPSNVTGLVMNELTPRS